MENFEIETILQQINICKNQNDLADLKSKILGKTGSLSLEFSKMKDIPVSEKKAFGGRLNQIKTTLEDAFSSQFQNIENEKINTKLQSQNYDISLPVMEQKTGSIHIVSKVILEVKEILAKYGFSNEDGPEIETDENNFTNLNIPADHPARGMHDTFYLEDGSVLRTHTSNMQIRVLKSQEPPLRFLSIGKTYRFESDKTHLPMFHQMEGVCLEKGVKMSQMFWLLERFLAEFFVGKNVKVRFRPSYFPFTEPSCEVDIDIGTGWLEVGGCGMTHRNVLNNCGVSNEYQAFAFGFGVERLSMLKYNLSDLRECYSPLLGWTRHYNFQK